MKIILKVLILIFVFSCGPYEVKVNPIDVNIKHSLDFNSLRQFFYDLCSDLLDNGSQEEINECAINKTDQFITNFSI